MSPRTSAQFERIRQEKTKLILDTALELFAERGYHGTSISDITKKAGISKGLVYNYFEGKEDVLRSILKTGYEAAYGRLDFNGDKKLADEEFVSFIRHTFRMIRENLHFWKLYSALMFQPGIQDLILAELSGKSHEIQNLMFGFLTSNGSKDPQKDMLVISSLIKGAQIIQISAPDTFPAEVFEETIIEACFRLIKDGSNKSKSV
jgi:AcrR family transcriptional regulator